MKIKKYKNGIKITTIVGIILNIFIYIIGIILLSEGKAFEISFFILIVAIMILGMIIYEKKIIKNFKYYFKLLLVILYMLISIYSKFNIIK